MSRGEYFTLFIKGYLTVHRRTTTLISDIPNYSRTIHLFHDNFLLEDNTSVLEDRLHF